MSGLSDSTSVVSILSSEGPFPSTSATDPLFEPLEFRKGLSKPRDGPRRRKNKNVCTTLNTNNLIIELP